MLNENFQYIVSKGIGSPRNIVPLTGGQLAYAKKHLPPSYVEFLVKFGLGNYFDHGVQLCDPEIFRPLLALIFKADMDFNHNDCHMVSYSAFGSILKVWSERHWIVEVDLLEYHVSCSGLFKTEFTHPLPLPEGPKRDVTADFVASGLLPRNEKVRECWDFHQDPMFTRCIRQHGKLQDGECFGFVPSLGLVGYESKFRSVDYVKRVKALEHFCIIAQMRPFRLARLTGSGYEYKREIG